MTRSSSEESSRPPDERAQNNLPTGQFEAGRLIFALVAMAAVLIGAYVYLM